jgi:RNA polymerase sigma-70 factor (ECF subfamily)
VNARIRSWKQGGGRPGDLAGQVYCILPRELADELYDVLVAWFADARDVTVIIDSRRRDRRRAERRLQEAPALGDRRSIRHRAGRRFFERRALGIDVSALTLPREARRHADRIRFLERLEPTRAEAMDRDSARLVARVQAGERAAYDDLYLRYFTAVYRYVRVIVGDDHEAEDITQETFISALDALPRYEIRPEQPFRVYLLRIARNRSVDHVRKHTPMGVESPEQVTRLREALEPEDPLGDLGWISDGELEGIVGRLPLQQRQALVLRFALGFSHDEVARILELTPQASRNLQHRALAFIRSRLAAVSRRSSGGERHTMALRARFGRVIAERKGSLRGPLARNRVA